VRVRLTTHSYEVGGKPSMLSAQTHSMSRLVVWEMADTQSHIVMWEWDSTGLRQWPKVCWLTRMCHQLSTTMLTRWNLLGVLWVAMIGSSSWFVGIDALVCMVRSTVLYCCIIFVSQLARLGLGWLALLKIGLVWCGFTDCCNLYVPSLVCLA
jgi:hypothetical protein